jgi:hypothetical protein
VRLTLALIRCGHRFYEVMSAVLGPLLLDQLPKSKPVTPVFSCLVSPWTSPGPSLHCLFTLPCQRAQANQDSLGPAGHRRTVGIRMPPWALAVAETHPRGLTGRVGAGQRPGLPRDEARFSSRRLGRNPPSGTQSLDKTPLGNRMVARSEKNWMIFCGARPELDGGPEQPVNGR